MVATKITVVSDEHQNCVGWGKKEEGRIEKKKGVLFFMSRSNTKELQLFLLSG